ncbi:formimidoylglutamase [Bowmanella pacifica]|uniref:Formimidoylglutamase HutG n=1 Tax=Bowmanella pacifica TaxID=502051 RepID=A0A917Z093_9ALTE|nr:formimidoylglutamase [Bowmanella pacifica]GGO71602.1 formimidoylglutamase HutG [Bowmanella pacifica]
MDAVRFLNAAQLHQLTNTRPAETKLGQVVLSMDGFSDYAQAKAAGCRFAVMGVPEQVGPLANCGKGGAHQGWQAFLPIFLNLQANSFLPGDDILLVGELNCDDLSAGTELSTLRAQCEALDQRLVNALKPIFAAGLIPILIGGGHNNAYGLIRACSECRGEPLAVANLDPHSDFRSMEGRHSGNPFRYAYQQGYLSHYTVLGLHEQKNSHDALEALEQAGFPWFSIQQLRWRRELSIEQALSRAGDYLQASGQPLGLELDLDAVSELPTSAVTFAGMSLDDALYYVHRLALLPRVQYLHLAEGAPVRHPAGLEAGNRVVGQALSELVSAFIKARYRA